MNRIKDGIKHKNKEELLWAIDYCQMRLGIGKLKEHKKHWSAVLKSVKETLDEIDQNT